MEKILKVRVEIKDIETKTNKQTKKQFKGSMNAGAASLKRSTKLTKL